MGVFEIRGIVKRAKYHRTHWTLVIDRDGRDTLVDANNFDILWKGKMIVANLDYNGGYNIVTQEELDKFENWYRKHGEVGRMSPDDIARIAFIEGFRSASVLPF